PGNYMLKQGDDARLQWSDLGPVEMNFVQPGGSTIAALQLPETSYPDTDFASAFFNVSINEEMTAEQCGQFAFPDDSGPNGGPMEPAKVSFAGNNLLEMDAFAGNDVKEADAQYYHTYQNGKCYEFALGLLTSGENTTETSKPVDRHAVFGRLQRI